MSKQYDEADWLGEDNEIVKRSRAQERADRGIAVREHRVVGPPGCGKTTHLSRQATRAASIYGHDGVLLASLTRTAAQEIAGRDTPIPREMIGTLHAHAYRVLDRPSLAETPDGLKEWNGYVQSNGLLPIWRMDIGPGGGDLDHAPAELQGASEGERLRNLLGTLRARQTPAELHSERTQGFSDHWASFKQETSRWDFTDLIERCLRERIEAPGTPAVIMLDEAQDMSRLELALARQWARVCEQLVVVADPAQALYAWRGSDPEALFDGEAESETVLEQSYRVPAVVHAYAVDWIKRMPGHRHFAYRPTAMKGEIRRINRYPWMYSAGLLDDIQTDLDQGRTVMVLATCGYMLAPIIAALREAGLPFHNPYRPTHGGWNPMRGARRLLAFLHPDPGTWAEEAQAWTYDDARRWLEPLRAKGLLERGAKTWIESKNHEDRYRQSQAGEQMPLAQLGRLFSIEEDALAAMDMDVDWWQRNHLERHAPASVFPAQVYRTHGGRALRERPRVTVGTVHSVKGGEADSVYLWPDISQAAYNAEWNSPDRRAPLYRTFYVAMTRAREKLTILPASGSTYVPLPAPEGAAA